MLMALIVCGFNPCKNTLVYFRKHHKRVQACYHEFFWSFLLLKDPHTNIYGLAASECAYTR